MGGGTWEYSDGAGWTAVLKSVSAATPCCCLRGTDCGSFEVVRQSGEQCDKVDKLCQEIRKLSEECAKKRVAVLTDDQRRKLINLVAGEAPTDKADPRAGDKDE